MIEIREDLQKFMVELELRLRKHDKEKGDSYNNMEIGDLHRVLAEEYNEFVDELEKNEVRRAKYELIDLACASMMVSKKLDRTIRLWGGMQATWRKKQTATFK